MKARRIRLTIDAKIELLKAADSLRKAAGLLHEVGYSHVYADIVRADASITDALQYLEI